MARPQIITALDIGTESIKAISCFKKDGVSGIEVLGHRVVPSFGIRKGVIVNQEKVSEYVKEVIESLAEETGQQIGEVRFNINGSRVFVAISHGAVAISRADQTISQEDIDRVMQAAQAISLSPNKEILDVYPREFIVDGEGGIKEAVGMRGVRLEVDILALCCFSPFLKNLTEAILGADLQISDVIPSPIAAGRAVLTSQQKELGVMIVDIGAGTTGLAVYEEGDLIHSAIFPVGSANITNDIAIGLKTEIDIAERIKKEVGAQFLITKRKENKREKILFPKTNPAAEFTLKDLEQIIEPRIHDIFDFIDKELKRISRHKGLPAGIVFTGGGAKLSGLLDLAKEKLSLPVRLGVPRDFVGLESDSIFSVVCGLALFGFDSGDKNNRRSIESGKGLISQIKKLFKNLIP